MYSATTEFEKKEGITWSKRFKQVTMGICHADNIKGICRELCMGPLLQLLQGFAGSTHAQLHMCMCIPFPCPNLPCWCRAVACW